MDKPTTCDVCGAAFESVLVHRWGWSTTCSRKCSKKRNIQRAKANREPNRTCEHCGKAFYASTAPSMDGKGRFCGQPCFLAHVRPPRPVQERPRWKVAQGRAARAAKGTTGLHQWIAGSCIWCGSTYLAKPTGGKYPEAYCSLRCVRKAARFRRRGRIRTQRPPTPTPTPTHIYRRRVFERDTWVCWLCGMPTLPDKAKTLGTRSPHPMAPTLDHVVPVSKGGEHSESNLRCAHFMCNALRGNADAA